MIDVNLQVWLNRARMRPVGPLGLFQSLRRQLIVLYAVYAISLFLSAPA